MPDLTAEMNITFLTKGSALDRGHRVSLESLLKNARSGLRIPKRPRNVARTYPERHRCREVLHAPECPYLDAKFAEGLAFAAPREELLTKCGFNPGCCQKGVVILGSYGFGRPIERTRSGCACCIEKGVRVPVDPRPSFNKRMVCSC